jgi:hypothetical protein
LFKNVFMGLCTNCVREFVYKFYLRVCTQFVFLNLFRNVFMGLCTNCVS